jgi:hypothetical protein
MLSISLGGAIPDLQVKAVLSSFANFLDWSNTSIKFPIAMRRGRSRDNYHIYHDPPLIVINYLRITLGERVLVIMDSGRSKEKELAKQLISLDLDEGIRIEQQSQRKKLFINRNACGNFVLQFVDEEKNHNSEINNIQYFSSEADVLEFVKSRFNKNFSISPY